MQGREILLTVLFSAISIFLMAEDKGEDKKSDDFVAIEQQEKKNDINDDEQALLSFMKESNDFALQVPLEKVYLHFDNTSYFQGENIWFKCYVVTAGQLQSSQLSKTLYVELLNPGGEIVDKRILKIENGQCHGEFTLSHLPFYSGFYEIRAYTKYMLNFGEDVIFSRLLPVFDKPKTEGAFETKKMLRYDRNGPAGNYPMNRPRSEKANRVNVRFFPEGGNLIMGVESRIAFEATDETGNPIELTGVVTDESKQIVCQFITSHEGRGVFSFTPVGNKGKNVAEVTHEERKYRFDLPDSQTQGVVMEVDNLSLTDSIGITLRRNDQTLPEHLGIAILCGNRPQKSYFAFTQNKETFIQIDKTDMPAGVSQIALFNKQGTILCDRLLFTGMNDRLEIKENTGKPTYNPYELIEMEFSVTDSKEKPVNTTFSLSVRDGDNEVESKHNILTDLLLMSDIKGFIKNPSYYFEQKNNVAETQQAASHLDVLLMVQGWRRYEWKRMAGIEPFDLKYLPEQAIETHGQVMTFVKNKPVANADVFLLLKRGGKENEGGESQILNFVADKDGRFAFISNVQGKWNMVLSVRENNKPKDHLIILDRVFSPEPSRYRFADLQVNIPEEMNEDIILEDTPDFDPKEDYDKFFAAYLDSLDKLSIDQRVHRLPEVVVKAKRRAKEKEMVRLRSTSVTSYDVNSEVDDILDKGEFISDDIHHFLEKVNPSFSYRRLSAVHFLNLSPEINANSENEEKYEEKFMFYKGKLAIFNVNYEKIKWNEAGYINYKTIRLPAIKSIYINENPSIIAQYIDSPGSIIPLYEIARSFSCVVFIETIQDGKIPVDGAKGVRKTWLDGYSEVKEFYNPKYPDLLDEPDLDYRRTLYWNPSVTTDETGKAKIEFYNNSRCKHFSISAETITPQGIIGLYSK